MGVTSLWIINRAGGLAYYRANPALEGAPSLSSNECLVIASTLQSVHAIAARISPLSDARCSGLQRLEWHGPPGPFVLHCVQMATGPKVLATATPDVGPGAVRSVLAGLHAAYADYALKNPFYAPGMPIRCDLFDSAVLRLFAA